MSFVLAASGQDSPFVSELKTNGAGGFPQKSAKVLIDDQNLKVSVASDSNHLAVQAIVWKDNSSTGSSKYPDSSNLLFSSKKDAREPKVDRSYSINPLRELLGLHYSTYSGRLRFTDELADGRKVTFEAEATSPLQSDTSGKGKIEYVLVGGQRVRIDTLIIPLSEIKKKTGDEVRVCYLVFSEKPKLKYNSCGYESKKDYFELDIPVKHYQSIILENILSSDLSKLIF